MKAINLLVFSSIGFLLRITFLVECSDVLKCLNAIDGFVITRNDPDYDFYNFQLNVRKPLKPKGYIVVKSSRDVSKAICCAKRFNLNITAASGQHSFEKFSYGSDEHWVIHLSLLDTVVVDKKKHVAMIEPGIRFKLLLQKLWNSGKYGIAIGTCPDVGISGFTLGGGYGLSSRKYGLMSDNLKGVEIVTADGLIRNVCIESKRKKADLFWALRGGGGGNFGIVTKFFIASFDASNVIIVILKTYHVNRFTELFPIWQLWMMSGVSNSVGCDFRYEGTNNTIYITFFINDRDHSKSEEALNSIRKTFPDITDEDIFIGDYVTAVQRTSTAYWTTKRLYQKSTSFYVSKVLNNTEITLLDIALKSRPFVRFLIEMYGGKINEPKPWETAFVHRNSYYVFQFAVQFDLTENMIAEEARIIGDRLALTLIQLRKDIKFMDNLQSYQNYVDLNLIDWQQRYYAMNYERLQRIKKYWDPNNFFRFPQSIKFSN